MARAKLASTIRTSAVQSGRRVQRARLHAELVAEVAWIRSHILSSLGLDQKPRVPLWGVEGLGFINYRASTNRGFRVQKTRAYGARIAKLALWKGNPYLEASPREPKTP